MSVLAVAMNADAATAAHSTRITSPNEQIVAEVWRNEGGSPRYTITLCGKQVLQEAKLGLIRDDSIPASICTCSPFRLWKQ